MFASIEIKLSLHNDQRRFWSNISGAAEIALTIPEEAVNAVDYNKLVQKLLNDINKQMDAAAAEAETKKVSE